MGIGIVNLVSFIEYLKTLIMRVTYTIIIFLLSISAHCQSNKKAEIKDVDNLGDLLSAGEKILNQYTSVSFDLNVEPQDLIGAIVWCKCNEEKLELSGKYQRMLSDEQVAKVLSKTPQKNKELFSRNVSNEDKSRLNLKIITKSFIAKTRISLPIHDNEP